jgi:hypothetical protein
MKHIILPGLALLFTLTPLKIFKGDQSAHDDTF